MLHNVEFCGESKCVNLSKKVVKGGGLAMLARIHTLSSKEIFFQPLNYESRLD